MPTYEYVCLACEAIFERFQSIMDAPVQKCPECGRKRVRRQIGAGAALLFKGSGFYITDYRSSEYSSKAKAEASPASTGSETSVKDAKTK